MDTTRWVVVGIVAVVFICGGAYWWLSNSYTNQITDANGSEIPASGARSGDTSASRESLQTGELTAAEQSSASAFATKVERYTQQRDFAKLYDLVCSQDRSGATKTEYVKALTNVWGATRLTSFEIKSVLEEDNGATVQLVENTSDGKSEAQLMTLEKSGSGWCFRSNITNVISQIKNFQNISLTVTNFKRPYVEQYQTSVEEGHERVRINVSITNNGDKPLACHALDGGETQCSEFFFSLKDGAGAMYTWSSISDAKMPQFTLAPHSTVSGDLVYEIPIGSSGYTLIFKDLGYGTDISSATTGF
ncbi:DUF4352 domain-containing protein [bacterium]|nr:DUF4352 domain-containing protein [bacterium]